MQNSMIQGTPKALSPHTVNVRKLNLSGFLAPTQRSEFGHLYDPQSENWTHQPRPFCETSLKSELVSIRISNISGFEMFRFQTLAIIFSLHHAIHITNVNSYTMADLSKEALVLAREAEGQIFIGGARTTHRWTVHRWTVYPSMVHHYSLFITIFQLYQFCETAMNRDQG